MRVRGESLRKKLYDLWVQNPYLTAKEACKKLSLNYCDHGNYANKLLSEFRSYYQFGSPLQPHLLPEHRVFEWEGVPRELLPGEGELEKRLGEWGWKRVVNRNGMWVWRDLQGRGSVHWYKGGLVRVYLRGELQLGKAKELFCRAFRWFNGHDLRKYLDVPLRETYRKWTFEMGQPVPRFDIRAFERSHGLRIFTDGSHPTSWHVGESVPFWLDEQRQSTAEFNRVVQEFGVEIREHLKLIRLWQAQAEAQLKPINRKVKVQHAPRQRTILEFMH